MTVKGGVQVLEAYWEIKGGNNDAKADTVHVGACRILLRAEAIAANVKSPQGDISTLQTPLKFISHTVHYKLDTTCYVSLLVC